MAEPLTASLLGVLVVGAVDAAGLGGIGAALCRSGCADTPQWVRFNRSL
ncbi:MAG: hypothetical protein M5U34_42855 [Chloroflexi bacterium]|nr:hypothetical protein [Chloroflexota bacterium]